MGRRARMARLTVSRHHHDDLETALVSVGQERARTQRLVIGVRGEDDQSRHVRVELQSRQPGSTGMRRPVLGGRAGSAVGEGHHGGNPAGSSWPSCRSRPRFAASRSAWCWRT